VIGAEARDYQQRLDHAVAQLALKVTGQIWINAEAVFSG
jgi:hypothetical protein